MNRVQLLKTVVVDINALILQGHANWLHAESAIEKLTKIIEDMESEEKAKEKLYNDAIEDAKKRREQMKAEAETNGEKIIGGETIRFNADGTKEVIIP